MNSKSIQYLKQGLVIGLTGGAVLILGLLSLSGMLAVQPQLGIGLASMGVAVLIEGEVYKQNISKGLARLFDSSLSARQLKRFFTDAASIKKRLILIHAAWFIAIPAGMAAVLVSISEMTAALSLLGVSVGALAIGLGIVPMAIIGGAGFAVMIHHTLASMIEDDRLRQIYRIFRAKIKPRTEGKPESTFHFVVRVAAYTTLCLALAGLAIFMTIATAGTWWHIVNHLPSWLGVAGKWLGYVALPFFMVSQFAFDTLNAMQSTLVLVKLRWHSSKVKAMLKHHLFPADVSPYNPFHFMGRFIELPFRAVVFLAHMVSVGVTADRVGRIAPWITALINSINDGLTDLHYFVPAGEEIACSHHHSDLPGIGLKFLLTLIPIYPLAIAFEFFAAEKYAWATLLEKFKIIYSPEHEHDAHVHDVDDASHLSVTRIDRQKPERADTEESSLSVLGCELRSETCLDRDFVTRSHLCNQ